MVRSDTDVLKSTPGYTRSMSAPVDIHEAVDDSIVDIMKLQRFVQKGTFDTKFCVRVCKYAERQQSLHWAHVDESVLK